MSKTTKGIQSDHSVLNFILSAADGFLTKLLTGNVQLRHQNSGHLMLKICNSNFRHLSSLVIKNFRHTSSIKSKCCNYTWCYKQILLRHSRVAWLAKALVNPADFPEFQGKKPNNFSKVQMFSQSKLFTEEGVKEVFLLDKALLPSCCSRFPAQWRCPHLWQSPRKADPQLHRCKNSL